MGAAPDATRPQQVRIKICGIRTPEEARAAADAGVDAVGLNLFAGPRRVTTKQAKEIVDVLPPFVTPVALTNTLAPDETRDCLDAARIRWIQWYGDWTHENIAELRRSALRLIRVVQVNETFSAEHLAAIAAEAPADALLFDAAPAGGRPGGTGVSFDWHTFAAACADAPAAAVAPCILAGGLTAANVAGAIHIVRPWAVDVASGVESRDGQKDAGRINAFVAAVRNACIGPDTA